MNKRFVLALVLLSAIITTGCTTKALMNIVDRPVPIAADGSSRNIEEVQAAVINGCNNRGWTPVMDGDAQVKCSISLRGRHHAEVLIPFSESTFSILLSSSEGLKYNPSKQTIHRNYNRWVANLALEIQRELGR